MNLDVYVFPLRPAFEQQHLHFASYMIYSMYKIDDGCADDSKLICVFSISYLVVTLRKTQRSIQMFLVINLLAGPSAPDVLD